ncbi:type I-E CRISPR-associated protein Cas6/Cse3/CasE [Nocardia suismassiliense]|uniref:type I-E CRISPR-associated protein Cas6/Cse3/CasE n=1 Tax=Nocardia suismassiliense TaxID=2077092 RepID=UPI000D1E25EF|nr:type I-E CRISPR-associated protein Cas6/Cse3/CasE [Nocardia suismassiliense]
MFLTRMQINPRRRGARILLSSPQALHAAVCSGFADATPSDEGRILWRLDNYGPHRVILFVASPDKPDFTHIIEQAGWPTTETWDTKPYERLLDRLTVGQRWQFRLTANPVHSGRREGWTDTKPLGHVTVRQQQQWLLDRASRHGFKIQPRQADNAVDGELELLITDRGVRRFPRGDKRVTISTATFEGLLEVTDAAALKNSLSFGIGRAKSYGCGLLTLAYPTTSDSPR